MPTPRSLILLAMMALFVLGLFLGLSLHSLTSSGSGSLPVHSSVSALPHRDPQRHPQRALTSHYRCFMEEDSERTCMFDNMCYDPSINNFVFFYDPRTQLPPRVLVPVRSSVKTDSGASDDEYVIVNRHVPAFPPDFVRLTSDTSTTVIGYRSRALRPVVRASTIPLSEQQVSWLDADVAALVSLHVPQNFGHSLGDDVFAVYSMARAFGVLTDDIQVLVHPDGACDRLDNIVQSCDHTEKLFGLLAPRRGSPLVLGRDAPFKMSGNGTSSFLASEPADNDRAAATQRPQPLVCVKRLLAGSPRMGMRFDLQGLGLWDEFIDFILRDINRAPGIPAGPTDQRILVFHKGEGQRRAINEAEMATYLRETFEIPVDVVDIATLTLEDQVQLVRKYSVVVTPCGGISFSTPFLGPGASAVYMGFWDTKQNASVQMERYIWQRQFHVNHFYYNVLADETAPVSGGDIPFWWPLTDPTELLFMRYRYGDVHVVLPRMARVVYEALNSAEKHFDWENSFSRRSFASMITDLDDGV